jgi:hypothetical protein
VPADQAVQLVSSDLEDAQEEVLGGDVFVLEALHLDLGALEDLLEAVGEGLPASLDPGEALQEGFQLALDLLRCDSQSLEDRHHHAFALLQQDAQQVFGLYHLVGRLLGLVDGALQGFLGFDGVLIEPHGPGLLFR